MNLLIIVSAVFLLFAFFRDGKKAAEPHPIHGTIFSLDGSSGGNRMDSVTDTAIYEKSGDERPSAANFSAGNSLPMVNVTSDVKLPGQFIAVVKPGQAQYKIVPLQAQKSQMASSKKSQAGKEKKITDKKIIEISSAAAAATPAPPYPMPVALPVVKKEEPTIIVNSFHLLNDAVKSSQNSYFYSDKSASIKNVTVTVLSLTPYQSNKDILKFQITNDQVQDYFFITNIALYQGKSLLTPEFFYKNLVASGKTIECIALIPRLPHSELSLVVLESGGKTRKFTINFTTT